MLTPREQLLYLTIKHKNDWNKIFADVQRKDFDDEEEIKKVISSFTGNYITILDNEYPSELRQQTYHPPFVLFYEGNIELLKTNKKKLAIGSSRETKRPNEEEIVDMLLQENDYVYIIGENGTINEHLAKNYDNKFIVVMGQPLNMSKTNIITRNVLEKGGLVITEYSPNSVVQAENFPRRNRIIAGLCDKLLVLKTTKQSSTNNLVSYALAQGKDVMVIPVSPLEQDLVNNQFIYDGAIPVWNKQVLCDIMG